MSSPADSVVMVLQITVKDAHAAFQHLEKVLLFNLPAGAGFTSGKVVVAYLSHATEHSELPCVPDLEARAYTVAFTLTLWRAERAGAFSLSLGLLYGMGGHVRTASKVGLAYGVGGHLLR